MSSHHSSHKKPTTTTTNEKGLAVVANAKPTSHGELPPLPLDYNEDKDGISVLLFYQYVEPLWTPSQHKRALRKLMELCQANQVTGRGRVAPEGLNCTLTGNSRGIRAVCEGLRSFDQLFMETDFKITDHVPKTKQFKSLSVRKTEELVAYGLKGDVVAPSLAHFQGTHLEANDYHEALQDPDAVVIDVRNFYETALGAFNPPTGGAKLMDPKLRNSVEFPRWLADPETQKELNGKKVLMYCTGGIRCERATALLNQMVVASEDNNNDNGKQETEKDQDPSSSKKKDKDKEKQQQATTDPVITCKPKGVFELRGGIERYVKTFPQGGFWKGKNYLFDRRMEQIPEGRSLEEVEQEIDSKCCVCSRKWTVYRGQYSCASKLCGVPVIVCPQCTPHANDNPQSLQCDLCRENYRPPKFQPDLAEIKRRAEERVSSADKSHMDASNRPAKKAKHDDEMDREHYPDRLFLSRLPLTATATKIQQALLPSSETTGDNNNIKVHWLTDQKTRAFYGSCVVQMPDATLTKEVIARSKGTGIKLPGQKKRIKVSYVWKRDDSKASKAAVEDRFSSQSFRYREYPPIQ